MDYMDLIENESFTIINADTGNESVRLFSEAPGYDLMKTKYILTVDDGDYQESTLETIPPNFNPKIPEKMNIFKPNNKFKHFKKILFDMSSPEDIHDIKLKTSGIYTLHFVHYHLDRNLELVPYVMYSEWDNNISVNYIRPLSKMFEVVDCGLSRFSRCD